MHEKSAEPLARNALDCKPSRDREVEAQACSVGAGEPATIVPITPAPCLSREPRGAHPATRQAAPAMCRGLGGAG